MDLVQRLIGVCCDAASIRSVAGPKTRKKKHLSFQKCTAFISGLTMHRFRACFSLFCFTSTRSGDALLRQCYRTASLTRKLWYEIRQIVNCCWISVFVWIWILFSQPIDVASLHYMHVSTDLREHDNLICALNTLVYISLDRSARWKCTSRFGTQSKIHCGKVHLCCWRHQCERLENGSVVSELAQLASITPYAKQKLPVHSRGGVAAEKSYNLESTEQRVITLHTWNMPWKKINLNFPNRFCVDRWD